jgi:hypothetical protein
MKNQISEIVKLQIDVKKRINEGPASLLRTLRLFN